MRGPACYSHFVVFVTVLVLTTSCTNDDNPAAPSQAPSVSIITLTQTPSYGEPVAFKAQYSGPALVSPIYTWRFTNDTARYTRTSDTITYTFYEEGDIPVWVVVVDTSAGIEVRDSVTIQVVDTRPIWERWNRMELTLYAKELYNYYKPWWPDIDTNIYYTDRYTIDICPAPRGYFTKEVEWKGMKYNLEYHTTIGNLPNSSAWHDIYTDIEFSPNGQSIAWLNSENIRYSRFGFGSSFDTTRIELVNIPLVSPLLPDSAVYRISGIGTFSAITNIYDHYYETDRFSHYRLLSIEPTSDMWIEIRCYKK